MEQIKELPKVGFLEAVKRIFTRALKLNTRSRRSEFWWGTLFLIIVSYLCDFIPVIGRYLNIVLILLNSSMTIRRLHDTGKSGWWFLTTIIIEAIGISLMLLGIGTTNIDVLFGDIDAMIPLIKTAMGSGIAIFGMLIWFVSLAFSFIIFAFTTMDSQREANKYGESPKYVTQNITD